jgi:ribonuclease J
VATVVIAIDTQTGKVAGDVELVTVGLVLGDIEAQVLDEARARITKVLARTQREGATDPGVIQHAVREAVSQVMWERARRRPMIIPIVMEV